MVDRAIAGAGHHQALHALSHQRIHRPARCPRMVHDDFHPRPSRSAHYIIHSTNGIIYRHYWAIACPTDHTLFHPPQRSSIPRAEGIDAVGMHFLHMPCAMHFTRRNSQHTCCTGRQYRCHRVQQVLGAIGGQGCGRPHRAGQHHGFGGVQHFVQEPRRFFQRVRTVGNDHPLHLRVIQVVSTPQCQRAPHLAIHVLAVDLRNLLCNQGATCQSLQTGHGRQQLLHAHLRGGVANVVARLGRGARNRATGAQNHNFLPTHLHTPKNW